MSVAMRRILVASQGAITGSSGLTGIGESPVTVCDVGVIAFRGGGRWLILRSRFGVLCAGVPLPLGQDASAGPVCEITTGHDHYFWKLDPTGEGRISKTSDHGLPGRRANSHRYPTRMAATAVTVR